MQFCVSRVKWMKKTKRSMTVVNLSKNLHIWSDKTRFFISLDVQVLLMEEIRRSPVEVGSLSHDLQGFYHHPRWLALGFLEPSTVCFISPSSFHNMHHQANKTPQNSQKKTLQKFPSRPPRRLVVRVSHH